MKNKKQQRYTKNESLIIFLAYFHRYGWLALTVLLVRLVSDYVLPISAILYAVWTFVGYKRHWIHIYCSDQNASHKKMTPNSVKWEKTDKKDIIGVSILFLILGIGGLVIFILDI